MLIVGVGAKNPPEITAFTRTILFLKAVLVQGLVIIFSRTQKHGSSHCYLSFLLSKLRPLGIRTYLGPGQTLYFTWAELNSTNLHELSSCEVRRLTQLSSTGLFGSAEAFFTATPGGNNG